MANLWLDDDAKGSAPRMANNPNVNSKEPAVGGGLVHVVVRLVDGGSVLAGSYGDGDEAQRMAEELLSRFAQPDTVWPLLDGRYVKPEAVVSIDLVEEEHRRWGGSAERAAIRDVPSSSAGSLIE